MNAASTGMAAMIATQGPIGVLTARLDDSSPLGAVESWTPALISAVRLILSSKITAKVREVLDRVDGRTEGVA